MAGADGRVKLSSQTGFPQDETLTEGLMQQVGALPDEALEAFVADNPLEGRGVPTPDQVMAIAFALWRLQHYTQARDALNRMPEECRNDDAYLVMRGMVLRRIPKAEPEAEQCFQRAIEIAPERSDAYYNLGNLLLDRDAFASAELNFRACLKLDPQASLAWHNLGIALNGQQRFEQAFEPLRISLQLDPASADAWCNLGLSYFGSSQFGQAQRAFAVAIRLDSGHGASHVNMGNALISLLEPDQALHYLERGVELEQSSANSLWNLSLAYLLTGDFRRGWDYYEARFATKNFTDDVRPSKGEQPRSLAACSRDPLQPLLVWTEQGIGDAIQFGRYLSLLDAVGVSYRFMTRKPLLRLFRDWCGLGERVIEQPLSTNPVDQRQQIPLLSLPRLFSTELLTIPSVCPYITPPEPTPDRLRVSPPPGGIAVGLVWATNPQNRAMYRNKSCPLGLLMPRLVQMVNLDLIDLHCLQAGKDADQLDPWRGEPRIRDWSSELTDFADTAHVVSQLDLVISVDTAVAHLAGALNRPTWVLLPCNADFRWMRGRSDSPWYPSMRLFRQPSHHDWPGLIEELHQALDQLVLLKLNALQHSLS